MGAEVSVARGALQAKGQLVWRDGKAGGIRFLAPIPVEPWTTRIGHSGQQQVDAALASLRGLSPEMADEVESQERSLASISASLDEVCNELAASADLSPEFGEKLVRLDFVAQELRRLATGRAF